MPELCVLVVAHGAAAETAAAVAALAASEGVEPFVVHVLDNSVDDAVETALAGAPRSQGAIARLVHTRLENRGFGAALNVGARRAVEDGCDLLLVLNPDCVVGPRSVAALLALSERAGDVVGAPLLSTSGGSVERWGGAQHSRWTSRNTPIGHGLLLDQAQRQAAELEARIAVPTGACMLVRSDDLRAAGWFDEDLFLYYEEVALVARMRKAGVLPRFRVAAQDPVVHIGGASTGSTARQSALTRFHASRSAVISARKYDRVTVPVLVLSRLVLAALDLRRGAASSRAVLAGTLAGLRYRVRA